jgi:DnaK suppressor protein
MAKSIKKPQGKKNVLKNSKPIKTTKSKSVKVKAVKDSSSSLAKAVKRIAMTLVKKTQTKKTVAKVMPKKAVTAPKVKVKAKVENKTKPTTKVTVATKTDINKKPASKIGVVATGPFGIKPYQQEKGETYMSARQLKHFTGILNAWKSQLMKEVDRTIYDLQEVPNYADPIDRASQEEEFNLKLRERDRERKLIRKIDEALLRIEEGNYGYCDECGAEIGVRRLEARPTATQCIECKTIAEIREKQTGT